MRKLKLFLLSTVCICASTVIFSSHASAQNFNYGEALQKSIWFYEVQQCGKMTADNRVNWRGDCHLQDGSGIGLNLTGGWHDAGDSIKFAFPMSQSAGTLLWGVYEYRDAYKQAGQLDQILKNVKWATDYLIKCHIAPKQYVYQVSTKSTDHSWWGPVEVFRGERPVYILDSANPGSCVLGDVAGTLALAYLVYRDTDPAYASECLTKAKELFAWADSARSDAGFTAGSGMYSSHSGYWDELQWAAAWLYIATDDAAYLGKAESYTAELNRQGQSTDIEYKWGFCWDDKHYGSMLLLARLTNKDIYKNFMKQHLDWWAIDGANGWTSGGLAWMFQWGSLRHVANTALLMFIYSDWTDDTTLKTRYKDFAKRQINYILGDNPNNFSYMIGFGSKYPLHPHHRTGHGSWSDQLTNPPVNRHTLYGALVGGPESANDNAYNDAIDDYESNEVACDYNSGFTGALAKMYDLYGGTPLANFPIPETPDSDEFFVTAGINSSYKTYIEIKAEVNNHSSWPARAIKNLSFKYFVDLTEVFAAGYSTSDIKMSSNYSEIPTIISKLTKHTGNIYYVQVSFVNGEDVYPGGQSQNAREVQFRLAAPDATDFWNNANDHSYTGLRSTIAKTEYIPLYDGNTRIYGKEPPGGENNPPKANDDTAITESGKAVTTNVIANDTDADGTIDSTSVKIAEMPVNGKVTVNSNGTVTYTPNMYFIGKDTYTYTVKDNEGAVSNEAVVTITVEEIHVNVPPIANDDTDSTFTSVAVTTNVLANDEDPDGILNKLTVTITAQPQNGSVSVKSDGTVTYISDADFTGTDVYSYTVEDNEAAVSNEATVTISVEEKVNIAPVANDDSDSVKVNSSVTTNVLANDKDTDGTIDSSTVEITSQPANGTVNVKSDGSIIYSPDTDFSGTDSYNYTVQDNEGAVSNEATVTIEVTSNTGNYDVEFDVTDDWGQGFNGKIIITNTGSTAIKNWTLDFDFDRDIANFWTAQLISHSGDHYRIECFQWNSVIQPGQSLSLGFGGNPGNVNNSPINYDLSYDAQ